MLAFRLQRDTTRLDLELYISLRLRSSMEEAFVFNILLKSHRQKYQPKKPVQLSGHWAINDRFPSCHDVQYRIG